RAWLGAAGVVLAGEGEHGRVAFGADAGDDVAHGLLDRAGARDQRAQVDAEVAGAQALGVGQGYALDVHGTRRRPRRSSICAALSLWATRLAIRRAVQTAIS